MLVIVVLVLFAGLLIAFALHSNRVGFGKARSQGTVVMLAGAGIAALVLLAADNL